MTSDDGSIVITVNGEIYNFESLRRELSDWPFRSCSDSEVVLHGYRAWGVEKLLDKLEGMFALTIFDQRSGRIFLARDHAGIKPLYFGSLDGYTYWASELKAVRRFFDAGELATDNTAIYDFLTYGYVPAPKTLYRNCYKVEPASYVTVDLVTGSTTARRYWKLPTHEVTVSLDEAAERIRDCLGASVAEQLVSDVPLGFFLSGGVDSSAVVSEATSRTGPFDSFSIGYDVAEKDESQYAAQVAECFGARHKNRILTVDNTIDLLDRMEQWYDEPFADTSALPTWHVSQLARENVSVVLTGDGGDELFGGYRWYKRYLRFRALQSLLMPGCKRGPRTSLAERCTGAVSKVARRVDLLSRRDPLELYASILGGRIGVEKEKYKRMLEIEDDYDDMWALRRFYRSDLPPRKRLQYLDFHTYLPDDILTKVDRVTMSVSLEARVPFLSRPMAELAFSLPEKVVYNGGELKGGLKYSYNGHLPKNILQRKKRGFGAPLHQWARSIGNRAPNLHEEVAQRYLS